MISLRTQENEKQTPIVIGRSENKAKNKKQKTKAET